MQSSFSFLIILFLLGACHNKETPSSNTFQDNNDHNPIANHDSTNVLPPMDYDQFKEEFSKKLGQNSVPIDSLKLLLFETLYHDIPQYWNGTRWDYNGTSQEAGSGSIACGYFVTTILEDLKIPQVRRIFHAQQASSVMIKDLCREIKYISGHDLLLDQLKNEKDFQVYIVGLDNHTGCILKAKEQSYFLHSSYVDAQGVVLEEVETSAALRHSNSYMLGNLSANESLLRSWGL